MRLGGSLLAPAGAAGEIERLGKGRRRCVVVAVDASTNASSAVAAAAFVTLSPAEDLEDLCPGPEAVAVGAVEVLKVEKREEKERRERAIELSM